MESLRYHTASLVTRALDKDLVEVAFMTPLFSIVNFALSNGGLLRM
jgi:hypothetical protein